MKPNVSLVLAAALTTMLAAAPARAIDCDPPCAPPYVCDTDIGECYFEGVDLVINEVDYDQPGSDVAEFIELYNRGPSPVNLAGYEVVLINGSDGAEYRRYALPDVGLPIGGFFVLCANAANTPNCDLDVDQNTDMIQNGAPDAIALFRNDVLIDVVSYEGDVVLPFVEGSGNGLMDPGWGVEQGISRFPDGTDTNVNNVDFSVRCITPGAPNSVYPEACLCGNGSIDEGEECDDSNRDSYDGCDVNCLIEVGCDPACVHGTCLTNGTCDCEDGWAGVICDQPVCEPVCVHGACTAPDVCTCEDGWEGPVCDQFYCDPSCVNGTCTGPHTCTCAAGWTGPLCDQPVCEPPCANGTCTAPGVCTCDSGWEGGACDQAICDPACVNGTCTAPDFCTCDEYWMGATCEEPFCDPACPPAELCIGGTNTCLKNGALVINEIDYDQPDTDTAEFIELYNGSPDTVNLDGKAIVLIDGSTSTEYLRFDLPLKALPPGGYYVVCANAANTPKCDLVVSPATNLIQNGAPDAVALYDGDVLIDTVSYEGDVAAPYTEGSGAGLEDPSAGVRVGLSRIPNALDTDVNNVDFSPRCITPGARNTEWNTDCGCGNLVVDAGEGCDDGGRLPGDGCSETCQVEAGWTCPPAGGACSPICDPACVKGTCTAPGTCTCEPGWGGVACDDCATDFWGPLCLPCPECVGGACDDGVFGTGVCTCDPGWTGDLCEACLPDRWGPQCQECPDCLNGACDDGVEGSGLCVCGTGWTGDLCDHCADDYWGTSCWACPVCVNGACDDGPTGAGICICEPGWGGENCDVKVCYPECEAPLVCEVEAGECYLPGALVINEIDYDMPGTDYDEFVEIYNTASADIPLAGVRLVLVNGSNSQAVPYQTIDLPPILLPPGGFYVVCGDGALVPNCDMDVIPDTNLIQNGGPDAVGLVLGLTVLDAVSYEGDTMEGAALSRYTETKGLAPGRSDTGFARDIGIARFPDGQDTDNNDADFSTRCVSPGAPNDARTGGCNCGNGTIETPEEACDYGDAIPGDGCDAFCQFEAGWSCDTEGCDPICDPACVNGACIAPDTCECATGWEGALCDAAICDPACVNGACIAPDACECATGWEGTLCDVPICDPACVHGACVAPNTCACEGNWAGGLCDGCADHWAGEACDLCADGYFGADCTGVCPACVNGACDDGLEGAGTCECEAGWAGELCDEFVCDPVCGENATCTGPNACECDEGFVGDGYTCEVANECAGAADWTACEEGACFGEACEAVGANDACEDAAEVALDEPQTGTFDGFHAWWTATPDCVEVDGGLVDAFFRFEAEAGTRYTVTVTPDGDLDLAVMVRGGCDPTATVCVAGANDGAAGEAEVADVSTDVAGSVWIQVVSVATGTATDFEVLVEEYEEPGEDDGGDNGFADEAQPDVIEPEDIGREDPGVPEDPGAVQDVHADAPPADAAVGDEKARTTGGGCVSTGATGASRTGVLVIVGLLGLMAVAFRRRRV